MLRLKTDITFCVDFKPYNIYNVKPCKKKDYDFIVSVLSDDNTEAVEIVEGVKLLIPDMPYTIPIIGSCRAFLFNYIKAINEYCRTNFEKFELPQHLEEPITVSTDDDKKEPLRYPIYTYEEHLIHDYTGLSFSEIEDLNILEYKFYAAESYKVSILQRVDGTGTQYLNECYDYMQEMKNFNIDDLLDDSIDDVDSINEDI